MKICMKRRDLTTNRHDCFYIIFTYICVCPITVFNRENKEMVNFFGELTNQGLHP